MVRVILCVLALLGAATVAEAHHVRRHVAHVVHEVAQKYAYHNTSFFGGSIVSVMEGDLGTNPTGWAHDWCSHYLGMVLHRIGLPDSGSNTAISYAHYGHPAAPAPGVIAVMPHHVGVVTKVLGDKVELVSGNHSHKVGIGDYSIHRIIAFRAP